MDYLRVLACFTLLACVIAEGPSPLQYDSGIYCKGSAADLLCPQNFEMTVNSFTFGTGPDGDEACGNGATSPICTESGALAIAKTSCDGKNNCSLVASNEMFGDGCTGDNLYMEFSYSCQHKKRQVTACESKSATVECPAGFAIGIFNYTYGRSDLSVCPKDGETNTECFSSRGPNRGVEMCAGREFCELEATNYAHGDPCPGTSKYLQVEYFCYECTNKHDNETQCEEWASRNQCKSNSGWMMNNCAKACTKCDIATCQNMLGDDRKCGYWASIGECEKNPNFMKNNCFKACTQCDLADSCANQREDSSCDYWTGDDECGKSPVWMTDKCRKSCKRCPSINADKQVAGFTTQNSAIPALEYWMTVCADSAGKVECENGYYIKMISGSYGRSDAKTCNSSTLAFTEAEACQKDPEAVLTDLKVLCENQTSCLIEASRKYFPSQCPDELEMYLEVHFLCAQPIYKASGCEGTGVGLQCTKEDEDISIVSAFYGRANNDVCPRDDTTDFNCSSSVATAQVDKTCGNTKECWVSVENKVLGDVCPDTPKYMEAEYICAECKNIKDDSDCEKWASWGDCESNKGWMLLHCRASCPPCKRDEFTNRHPNEQECIDWSAGGECTSNPNFMLKQCAGACNEKFAEHVQPQAERDTNRWGAEDNADNVRTLDEVCETAEDKKDDCQFWGVRSECDMNPTWMSDECSASCNHCGGCKIAHRYGQGSKECDKWAMAGECKSNPNFMAEKCNASCPPCLKEEDLCVNIEDDDDCLLWASNGECHTNSAVLKGCPRSCGMCGVKRPYNETHLDKSAATACENVHNDTMCEVYRGRDLCVRGNREWMLANCRQSCGVCDQPRLPKNLYGIAWHLTCESQPMNLQCYYGMHINVLHAFYGRDRDNMTCPNGPGDVHAQCYSFISTLGRVRSICNGRENCKIDVKSSVFGDPCPGVAKYLEVTYECTEDPSKEQTRDVMVTDKVFYDIEIGGEPAGRIVVGLFGNTAPFAVKNHIGLIQGFTRRERFMHYRGATFHRIIQNFTIQGGDFDNGDGTGFSSIYGGEWPDTRFDLKHYGPGWLGMANRGPNSNGMQFYIIMQRADWLDGKHIIFGKVLEGMGTAYKMQENPTDNNDKPIKDVVIADCGVLPVDEPFPVSKDPATD